MDRGGWQVTVHKVTKNLTRLKRLSMRKISDRTAITNAYIAMLPEVPIETSYCGFRGSFSLVISHKSLNRMNRYLSVSSVQFSSVAQSCPTLWDPMNRSTPGLPVHYQFLESTQTHAHRVGDAIQPSHPLSFPSPPAPNPSQHQGLFQWVNSSNEVAKVLEFQLQHQSFQWTPRTDLLQDGLVGSPCTPRDS